MIRVDPQLLQQWRLILEPVCLASVASVGRRRLAVRHEHLACVGRVLGHEASLVPPHTAGLPIVELLEVLVLE